MADEKTFTQEQLDAAVEKAVEKAVGDLEGLKEAKDAALKEAKDAKAKLRAASEIKPEDMATLEAENDRLKADLATATKTAKEATTAREKAEKALETESAFTQKLLIQDGLKSALIENGVTDPDYIDMAVAKFTGGAKVVVEGEERKAMFGDKPLADHIKEWAATDAGKKVVSAPANSGGGAEGGKAKEGGTTILRSAYQKAQEDGTAGDINAKIRAKELTVVDDPA